MSFGLHPLYLYKLTSSVLTTKMKAYGRACGLFLFYRYILGTLKNA